MPLDAPYNLLVIPSTTVLIIIMVMLRMPGGTKPAMQVDLVLFDGPKDDQAVCEEHMTLH